MATVKQNIQKAVRDMLIHFTDCNEKHILCGYNNEVSLPDSNDYIIFTVMNPSRIGTPIEKTVDNNITIYQDYRCQVQIDFYGDLSFDRACDIVSISRTGFLCDFLKKYGIQPIFADDAQNMTGVSGEREYVNRWLVMLEFDYRDAVSDIQEVFDTAVINKIYGEI